MSTGNTQVPAHASKTSSQDLNRGLKEKATHKSFMSTGQTDPAPRSSLNTTKLII